MPLLPRCQSIVTIDYETFYDGKYSLKSKDMSTSLYILDPKFEVIGVGVKVDDDKALWMEGYEFAEWAKSIDWSVTAALAHHAHFDSLITTKYFDIHPMFWLDTLSMARIAHSIEVGKSLEKLATIYGLGTKGKEVHNFRGMRRKHFTPEQYAQYGEYCKNDTELEYALLNALLPVCPPDELELIDATIKMFCEPTLMLDTEYVTKYAEVLEQRKEELISRAKTSREELMSNEKFAQLLMERGIEPGTKISGRTQKETWAFSKSDPFMQQILESDDDEVRFLAEARLGIKSTGAGTRAARFLRIASQNNGFMPIYLNYGGAHTYRWSGGDKTNFQNLNRTDGDFDPDKFETRGALRWAIVAPEGFKLLVWDSSQIEARTLAWFAGHQSLVSDFANKVDVYSKFASRAYGRPVDRKKVKADKTPGFVGKVCVLGLGYGMGAAKLGTTLMSGAMGEKVVFTAEDAANMNVSVQDFLVRFKYGNVKGEAALDAIPTLLSFEQKLYHFAVSDHLVREYRAENEQIVASWKRMDDVISYMADGREVDLGLIRTVKDGLILPNGLVLRYPNLHWSEESKAWHYDGRMPWPIKLYGGLVIENVIQALARLVISFQMLQLRDRDFHIATMTHDEIVCIEEEEKAEVRNEEMGRIMLCPPSWAEGLPLGAEGGVGRRYGEVK